MLTPVLPADWLVLCLEDFVDVEGCAPKQVVEVRTVAHEIARLDLELSPEHRWKPVFQPKLRHAYALRGEKRGCHDKHTGDACFRHCREPSLEVVAGLSRKLQ